MITDRDGHALPHAWANAWAGDPDMEGLRVRVEEIDGRLTAVDIHPEDRDAALRWTVKERSRMMDALTAALRADEAAMVNDEGEDAWRR